MNLKPIHKYSVLVLSVVIVGLLLIRFVGTGSSNHDIQLATVSPSSFDIRVNTVGVLDTERAHTISSAIGGNKGKIVSLIEDGTWVKKGDVLVILDATPFEEAVRSLKGTVEVLKAEVQGAEQKVEWEKNQTEREIRTAEFNLRAAKLELKKVVEGDGPLQLAQYKEEMERAREEYARYESYIRDLEELNEKGFSNPTEVGVATEKAAELKERYDSGNKKYVSYKEHVLPSLIEAAKAKAERTEMELEQTKKGATFKVASAVATVGEAQGKLRATRESLKQAESDLEKTTIHAPFSGIAILFETFRDGEKRKPRVGDQAWQNQPLLYLPDMSSMIVKTQIREIDLHKVRLGQKSSIRVDAYPDALFEGEVSFIGVLASKRFEGGIGEKYFQLTVTLQGDDSRLRPGMTTRVSILTDSVKSALCVPSQAVFDEGGKKYCYLYRGRNFARAEVSLGKQNEDLAEIVSGLAEGDKVSLVRPPQEEAR
ncbi:MAG: efflux RND transporter periplasmic adaptor subunit [Thermodesulfobacteriota bacterium]|nr:efflux RND transporter periplasmic adaptor subunit [Thermodesulfobacteriota bacterium]